MSDQTQDTTAQTTNEPAKADKPKRVRSEKVTVSQMAVKRAKNKGIGTDRAAKEVRGFLRANFDTIVKLDPTILKSKSRANDGNRWPAMNAKVAEYVAKGKRAS